MRVRVIVKNETYNDDLQAKANGLLPAASGEEDAEEDAEEVVDDAEDTEVEEDTAEDEAEDEAEEGPDLAGMNRTALKKFIKDEGLEVKVTTGKKDDDLRAEVQEALDARAEEEPEDEPEEDEEEGSVEDDIKDLDRAGLKAYIKENGLDVTVRKSWDDDAIRAAIIEAWPDDEDEADDSEPPF
jgi:hypothetical protein